MVVRMLESIEIIIDVSGILGMYVALVWVTIRVMQLTSNKSGHDE